ncbi:MAG TPA: TonB-dependent receptor, partial [Vicinamibacteria bacterium]
MSSGWRRGVVRATGAMGLAAALGAPAFAQGVTAKVEGVITDSSGAAVPGATVTATQLATNAARDAVSDGQGRYALTALPLGEHRVQVSLSGFKPKATRVTLTVNESARLDFVLEVGALDEVVEVSGAAPLIEKTTSFIGTVIERQQVEELPLNGRNFTQLTTLTPGVTRGVPGSSAAGASGEAETFRYGEVGGGAISVNGLREQFNNFLIDGIDNNETLVNSLAYFPSPEALQEFQVITTNAPAEFGRAGGAITNIVTKSGSNTFHGSAYLFNRAKGLAATPTFASEKPEFGQNDFGATLGGPILRDQTFFFLSYHGLRSTIPVEAGNRVTVPTARMRSGDFSELLSPGFTGSNAPITLYDPLTGQPFAGNIIPSARLDPVAVRYLNSFPLPDLATSALRNYLTHREKKSTFHDFDGRLDHKLGASDQGFVRASVWNDQFSDPGRIPGFQAGFGSGTSRNKGFIVGAGETHSFSGNLINELRLGHVGFRFEFLPVGFGEDQDRALGIPGPGGVTVDNGLSLIGGGDGRFIEYLGDFGQYIVRQSTWQASDTLTWVRGSHQLKGGFTVMRRGLTFERTRFGKGFYFYSDFTATPGNVPPLGQSGYEVADMLLGRTQFTATGVPGFEPRETISWENALFVQDDWRATRNLTLNLGLRYDLFTPYYERDDKLANYDPATRTLVLPGQNGVPRATVDTDHNNFGPRAGFAYILGAKTVVRGSYGIFYSLDRGGVDNQLSENPPAVVTQFRFDGAGSRVRLSDPIPLPAPVSPTNPVLPDGSGVVFIPRDNPTTLVQQFSAGVQRELDASTAVMVSYVGTRGDNLTAVVSAAGFGGAIEGRLTTLRNIAESKYDSLQVSLRRNESAGLSYLASYTLGKADNNSPGQFPGNSSAFR